MFCKKAAYRNFAKYLQNSKTPVPEPLFDKVSGLRSATLLKKRLFFFCFAVNFAKILRTLFL